MQALILEEPGRLRLSTCAEPPAPKLGEALVRVHRIGVCGTDYHAFRGRQPFFTYPRILGHELGVEIVEINAPHSSLRPGDRCAVEPYLNCEKCIACRRGKPNCCTALKVLGVHIDGGMQEQITVPAHKLHPSNKLSFEQLALVETLGIGAHAVDRAGLQKDEFVLVIGAGPIGLATMQFAREAGAKVIALDISESRLHFCRDRMKVPYTIHAARDQILDSLLEITNTDLPTAVFDATGNPTSMMDSFEYPAHGGRIIFVGLFQGDVTFNDPAFHRREMTLMSSRNAPTENFPGIVKLIEEEMIDTTPWITHRASFEDVVNEFPAWVRPDSGVIKAMIEI